MVECVGVVAVVLSVLVIGVSTLMDVETLRQQCSRRMRIGSFTMFIICILVLVVYVVVVVF